MSKIDKTLDERHKTYGKFSDQAEIFTSLVSQCPGINLPSSHRLAIFMIILKISRLLNGNSSHADTWHDIAGYAKLIEDELNGVSR